MTFSKFCMWTTITLFFAAVFSGLIWCAVTLVLSGASQLLNGDPPDHRILWPLGKWIFVVIYPPMVAFALCHENKNIYGDKDPTS